MIAPSRTGLAQYSEVRCTDYSDVLAWVTADSEVPFSVEGLSGVTETQGAHLGRLSALILQAIVGSGRHTRIAQALAKSSQVCVPGEVRAAFERVVSASALTNLASLYADIVKADNRRTLGTFFTPAAAAARMVAEYAESHPAPRCVVDVGAGVGVFSAAARDRWSSANIKAVDINPVTLGLQAVALRVLGDETTDLVLSDYPSWLASREPGPPTLYLGNPPYTRWQLIPREDRDVLLEATQGLVGARANLSTVFLAISLLKLRPEDGLSLIVPAGWMSAAYAKNLRAYVRNQTSRAITLRLADSWRFEGAIVDAVVVEVGPAIGGRNQLMITDWLGATQTILGREQSDESPFIRDSAIRTRLARSDGTELSEYGRFTRGVATGANSFFVRTVEQADKDGIDPRWRTDIVRRMRPGSGPAQPVVETSTLLNLRDYQQGDDATIDELVADAERAGINERHLCASRERWFDLSAEVWIPDVVLSSFGRDSYHVHVNNAGHSITNNLFGWTWKDSVALDERQAILEWLTSEEGQRSLALSATREANGLHRLSPRALMHVQYPQPG
ncbi:Eco57I restriction-modification methylase domain-containing protein [Tessaracoccus caeni]|uniref:Eco57I restriction-modification methylase domain-containing protein n=1 Tax=Tessaracoccus caeni TaxID=3031239 RepID=UPI0023DAAFBD|nr:hypothetical protein [Tessaracoccus caeni]MDF1489997.1 hypothetical protein [Tessaracoccus caeni]